MIACRPDDFADSVCRIRHGADRLDCPDSVWTIVAAIFSTLSRQLRTQGSCSRRRNPSLRGHDTIVPSVRRKLPEAS